MAARSGAAGADAQGIAESRGVAAGFRARSPRARRKTHEPGAHRRRSDARRLSRGTDSIAKAAQAAIGTERHEVQAAESVDAREAFRNGATAPRSQIERWGTRQTPSVVMYPGWYAARRNAHGGITSHSLGYPPQGWRLQIVRIQRRYKVGLAAVVFRSKDNLQLGADEPQAHVDADTGQTYFDDVEAERRHGQELQAAWVRFGNIALVSWLRDEIDRIIGSHSLLYTKVLYSGSHSGDFIPVSQLARLSEEISAVRKSNDQSEDLIQFLGGLEELIRTAHQERNPIVFI